jgi:hypothetical protein
MRGVLDRIARAGHPPMHALSASQARLAYERVGRDSCKKPQKQA